MNANILAIILVALPAAAAALLGFSLWGRRGLSEAAYSRITAAAFIGVLGCALGLIAALVHYGPTQAVTLVGHWFEVGEYHFDWLLVADRLSIPFALFCGLLVGVIGAFSRRYLHREPGYFRFYFLLALFGAGVELVVMAGNLDLIFIGWEIVGLTSALLIAFFHERRRPVENGFRAFVTYRLCDVGLLAATVWTHHIVGSTELVATSGPWGGFPVPQSSFDVTLIGLLLLWATMGKSAQVPLGGWLPRAMEGPTPSSAIFYGAISIHLGPYLLLRAAPILEASTIVSVAVVAVGSITALHATFVGRVQTDIKSALAYASMTQVGLIFVEIGLGLRYLALIHIVGHAALRSLQILRSPSLLHDHHHLEQAMGSVLPATGGHIERLIPQRLQPWLYRHALERGYFDNVLRDWVVGTFVRFFRALDGADQRFTAWIAGQSGQPGQPGQLERRKNNAARTGGQS